MAYLHKQQNHKKKKKSNDESTMGIPHLVLSRLTMRYLSLTIDFYTQTDELSMSLSMKDLVGQELKSRQKEKQKSGFWNFKFLQTVPEKKNTQEESKKPPVDHQPIPVKPTTVASVPAAQGLTRQNKTKRNFK